MNVTLDLLGGQHQDVLGRLDEVERALGAGDSSALAPFASYLVQEVAHHFEIEEQALFPLLARHLGSEQGPLAVMNAEHASFRELLRQLSDGLDSGRAGQAQERARDIIGLLRGHIAKEDGVLFPMATRVLSPEELQEVDARAAALGPAAHPADPTGS
jgi:hemerythrin-like domain-containing protein